MCEGHSQCWGTRESQAQLENRTKRGFLGEKRLEERSDLNLLTWESRRAPPDGGRNMKLHKQEGRKVLLSQVE